MTSMSAPLIVSIRGHAPVLHAESWVAPNASVIGKVSLAARVSVWYGATLRAEAEHIEVEVANNRYNAEVYRRLLDLHRASTDESGR